MKNHFLMVEWLEMMYKEDIRSYKHTKITKISNLDTGNDQKIGRMHLMSVTNVKQIIKSFAIVIPQKLKELFLKFGLDEKILSIQI